MIEKLLKQIKEDKVYNMSTTSFKFKRDVWNFFQGFQDKIAVEFGTHKGQTTRILSFLFKKVYTINNKSGNIIPPEYLKIIPAMGLTRDNHTGNLIIHFILEFPAALTGEQIETLEKIL